MNYKLLGTGIKNDISLIFVICLLEYFTNIVFLRIGIYFIYVNGSDKNILANSNDLDFDLLTKFTIGAGWPSGMP